MSRFRREIIGDCELILGDCREVMPDLTFDCVLTDPPFGIDYQSGYRTDVLWDSYTITGDANVTVRDEALSLLPDGMAALVFGSWKAARPLRCRAKLTWDKGPALGMGALDIPWKPSSEEIYVLGKGFVGVRDEGDVIYCPPVQSMAKNGRQHPNEKPVALLGRLLKKLPAGTVCDPFMGSGSTGVACAASGRAFVGCEVSERYFDTACRRIEQAHRQPRLFAEPHAKPVQPSLLDTVTA